MVVNRRKKVSRQRGSKTHGWGEMKKHRGAGNRGGRGKAGTGKRADQKKPSYWKERHFGKKGFKKKGIKKEVKPINIRFFEENFDRLLSENKIKKEDDYYVVDLKELGFNKLLSEGKVTKKFKIKTELASAKVIEMIKKVGGEVILTKEK